MVNWQEAVNRRSDWNKCFGCGQENPIGLKLRFAWDGKEARAEFTPREVHQGWPGMVQGGIIATLLDEASGWAAIYSGKHAVTGRLDILYRRPAPVGVPLIITGSVLKDSGRRLEISARINTKSDGSLIAECNAVQITINHGSPPPIGGKNTAVIWDMDGVIVDTAEYHFRAWQHVFQQQGIDFTRGDFAAKFGQRNDAIIRSIIGGEMGDAEVGKIAKMKEEFFRDMARSKVRAWPGALELVQRLTEQGWPQALATSAPPENIELLLGSLDLKGSFQQIVSGQEVTASKPSPQVFQRAAEKLGVLPAQCIVIEDAVAGVAAAKAAGMHCIAVTTSNPGQALRGADLVVDSLTEVTVSMLKQLLVGIK